MKPAKGAATAPQVQREGVTYEGLQYSNLPARLGDLCVIPRGGVDWKLWLGFNDYVTLDDMLDLEEISDVGRSWRSAAEANHNPEGKS